MIPPNNAKKPMMNAKVSIIADLPVIPKESIRIRHAKQREVYRWQSSSRSLVRGRPEIRNDFIYAVNDKTDCYNVRKADCRIHRLDEQQHTKHHHTRSR